MLVYTYSACLCLITTGQHSSLLHRKCNATFCVIMMFAVTFNGEDINLADSR
jgi:hypothetical protein